MKVNRIFGIMLSVIICLSVTVCLCACQSSISTDEQDYNSEFAETECQHDYIERDGRVVCTKCKDVCIHSYSQQNGGTFCDNCLFACKHPTFSDSNGNMICDNCGTVCIHNFAEGKCKVCGYICIHEYKMENGNINCSICFLECPHKEFIESESEKLCINCGFSCFHNYIDGICQICHNKCIHEYIEHDSIKECGICGIQEIILTPDNISEYLDISLNVIETSIDESLASYLLILGECTVEITFRRLKPVVFKDASIYLTLHPSLFTNWADKPVTITIPYYGDMVEKKELSGADNIYLSSDPGYKTFTIRQVSGTVIEEKAVS